MNQWFVIPAVAERLLDFLEKPDNRHALIIGAPGIGKTAILQFASERLKQDGCVVTFFSTTTASSVDELIAGVVRALDINEAVLPASLRGYQGTLSLRPLFEHLRTQVDPMKPIFLFIDDIDQLPESRSLASLFTSLIEDADRLVRLVLASRPSAISSRLQRNRSIETFELLGLTLPESAKFLQARSRKAIPTETLASLIKVANGNPLILQMLGTSLDQLDEKALPALDNLSLNEILDRVVSTALDRQSENAKRVLTVLAVFGSATAEQLSAATGLPTEDLMAVFRGLANNGLLIIDKGTANFSHALIRERVVKRFVMNEDVSPAILVFGDEAAERDKFLAVHFVAPPDQDQIIAGAKTIVLGDRGAGKSAIFRSLEGFQRGTSADSNRQQNVVVAVSKDPGAFIQRFKVRESGVSSADQFKALWLFFTSVLAAREVHPRMRTSGTDRQYLKAAWKLLRQVGWGDAIRGQGRVRRMWVSLKSILPQKIAFTVGPVKIEPGWTTEHARSGQHSALEIGDFLKLTDDILVQHGLRLLIVVDQVDELYKYDRKEQEAMVQGLFLAESYLSQTRNMRLIVLLRTDLFGVYDIQEKNKFVSRTVHLRWAWPDLVLQLLRRTYANDVLQAVSAKLSKHGLTVQTTELHLRFLFPETVEGVATDEWLSESLQNGKSEIAPRQIILFLNFLKQRAPQQRSHVPIFTEEELIHAMADVSESAFQEVVSDFRVAITFVRNCRAAKLSAFKLDDVDELFDLSEGPISVQVELLDRLGFLAREPVEENGKLTVQFRIPGLFTRCWA